MRLFRPADVPAQPERAQGAPVLRMDLFQYCRRSTSQMKICVQAWADNYPLLTPPCRMNSKSNAGPLALPDGLRLAVPATHVPHGKAARALGKVFGTLHTAGPSKQQFLVEA